jgi:hypothetical protein
MSEIEYKNILTIHKDLLTFEYDRDSKKIELSWFDEEGEEYMILLYDNGWHLEDSPIKDMELLEFFLKTFKEYK